MANKAKPKPRKLSVYFYVPNLIGVQFMFVGLGVIMSWFHLSKRSIISWLVMYFRNTVVLRLGFVKFIMCYIVDSSYMRILLNCHAFAVCFSSKRLFAVVYFLSFICDAVVCSQTQSRISTACLLVILSQVYRSSLAFLSLLAIDISSHWLQMYSTFVAGKASHKEVKRQS